MKNLIKISIMLFIGCCFAACDIVENVSEDPNGSPIPTPTGDTLAKRVLLEEYTGHQCGNCPPAAVTAKEILAAKNGRVSLVTIHAGFFARTNASGKYSTNFVVPEGLAYYNAFSVSVNPIGTVDRKDYSGSKPINESLWEEKVTEQLTKSARVYLKSNHTYDVNSRLLEINTRIVMLNNVDTTLRILALITEDKIVDWQTDYSKTPPDVSDYSHSHVLRGSMNSTWGDELFTTSAIAGANFSKSFSLTLNPNWNANNCSVVIFVYNDITKEVEQVEELKIIQ